MHIYIYEYMQIIAYIFYYIYIYNIYTCMYINMHHKTPTIQMMRTYPPSIVPGDVLFTILATRNENSDPWEYTRDNLNQ